MMRTSSLKTKFIIFAFIIILPIATSNLVSVFINKKINNNYSKMLYRLSVVDEIKADLADSLVNFNKYIQVNAEENKQMYEQKAVKAMNNIVVLQLDSFTDSDYVLRDLKNCIESYRKMGDLTIKHSTDRRGIDYYYADYLDTKEIAGYCDEFINKLINSYLDNNSRIYDELNTKARLSYKILLSYIAVALLISAAYTMLFLGNILNKLKELVDNSKKVSAGDFNDVEGKATNIYELDILSDAFNAMVKDVQSHIDSLKEKAELERKLGEEEMKLLKSKTALKLSQLKVLQSQINPHFLFNTLNCINQTAIKEKAGQTGELIRSVSGILRYSLSRMDRNATLEEEVNVVRQYMHIQQLRFDDRVKFGLSINANLKKYMVPGMTLQPFVENAFIHGIEPKEDGGIINIAISEADDFCTVMIEDTGCGMNREVLDKLIEDDLETEKSHTGHTTGLGVKSVVKRLQLLYDREDMFFIESEPGHGTRVFLRIPAKVEVEQC